MKYILIIAVFLTSFSCCKKNPYTKKTTGKYFYCKIDGVDYSPNPENGTLGSSPIKITNTGDTLIEIATVNSTHQIGLFLSDSIKLKQATYLLSNNSYQPQLIMDDGNTGFFKSDNLHTGTITISKIDYNNKIIEGTFLSSCYNSILNKTANITDGEFSLFFNQ
jgi:hypothetical protein